MNFKAEDFMEPKSDRWEYSNFSVYQFASEYLESDLEAVEVRKLMSDYVVNYDFDPHLYEDRIILDMICEVNLEADLPGYRFASLFMPEFKPLFSYEGVLSSIMITADDLEFFLKSVYLSVHANVFKHTLDMPLGSYFLPPPDMDKDINDLLTNI